MANTQHSTREFFESNGSTSAVSEIDTPGERNPQSGNTFTDKTVRDTTSEAFKQDATNLEYLDEAITIIENTNKLRRELGLPELKINDKLMAEAEINVNWSSTIMDHAYQEDGMENLAWNYGTEPLGEAYNSYFKRPTGWYYEEKATFDELAKNNTALSAALSKDGVDSFVDWAIRMQDLLGDNYGSVGHYVTFMNPFSLYTGAAFAPHANLDGHIYNDTENEIFFDKAPEGSNSYTTAEYRTLLQAFKDNLTTDAQKKVDDAQAEVGVKQDAADKANAAVTAAQSTVTTAQKNVATATTAKTNADEKVATAQSELDAAEAAKKTADAQVTDANAAVTKATADLDAAKTTAAASAAAKQQADEALAAAKSDQTAKQQEADKAKGELETAKANATAAGEAVTAAQKKVDGAQEALDALRNTDAIKKAQEALDQANTELTKAKADAEAANAAAAAAQKKAGDAGKALADAQKKADDAKAAAEQADAQADAAQKAADAAADDAAKQHEIYDALTKANQDYTDAKKKAEAAQAAADAAALAAKDAADATDAAAQNATDKAKALADAKQAQAEALADLAMARDHANRLLAIIFGKGTSYDLSTNPTIKMGANGDLSYFENIFLDGKKLSLSEYKAQRGSTYVLLSDATAQALAIGTHSLTFEYEYGSVTGSFSVTRPTPTPEHNDSTGKKNATTKKDVTTKKDATPAARHAAATVEEAVALPQTGDDLPSAPLAGLLAMLGLGAIGTSRHRAKHMAD